MARTRVQLSTGLPELDRVLRGLMPGDNIVWQVDSIDDYLPFVVPYAKFAKEHRQKLIYFRFADHAPLLSADSGAEIFEFETERGFEPFLAGIHRVISTNSRGTMYLFDCLSELAPDWRSDRMLGNFFMLTCPYLYDRAAIAYFALLRNYHSFHAVNPIANTTQILINAYRHKNKIYIHPLKVQHRYSHTMYMLHVREGNEFCPVTQSGIITEILSGVPWSRLDAASYQLGYWSRTFAEAEALQTDVDRGVRPVEDAHEFFTKLLRMMISHENPVLELAQKYLSLRELLAIRKRMIGTGLIGGKAVGMILARAILKDTSAHWEDVLEPHDSFYVGSDVFYTYLVQNGYWWMVQRLKSSLSIDDATETVRRRILTGEFPEYIVKQFADMLEYFGQSPIIVRSSSIMEDNFGTAFAGKYESVFCANQGGPHKRLEDFLCAVRTVYASTMSEEALTYRSKRSLLGHDEQMGLLIQRVSGASYGHLFFPQAAGVSFSFNPYVWHNSIDPEAGMIRLVFGMGTRAVDRSDDDYTRIVAINEPLRRPESTFDEVRDYAQRRVDVLDLEANHMASIPFEDLLERCREQLPVEMYAARDRKLERSLQGRGQIESSPWVLTFDKLLSETNFVQDMKDILQTLQHAYKYPVDVEFTLNFFNKENYKINLVQCRPLQIYDGGIAVSPPQNIAPENLVLQSRGPVIGKSTQLDLDWLIYVVPGLYGKMPQSERYAVARAIGEITSHTEVESGVIMLLGPGRWGTTTPELGVPVSPTEIQSVNVLCEIVAMHDNLVPDVSLGTHFFNELVENDMLYLAFFPNQEGHAINTTIMEDPSLNCLTKLFPELHELEQAVRVLRASDAAPGSGITINADTMTQRVVCYRT